MTVYMDLSVPRCGLVLSGLKGVEGPHCVLNQSAVHDLQRHVELCRIVGGEGPGQEGDQCFGGGHVGHKSDDVRPLISVCFSSSSSVYSMSKESKAQYLLVPS